MSFPSPALRPAPAAVSVSAPCAFRRRRAAGVLAACVLMTLGACGGGSRRATPATSVSVPPTAPACRVLGPGQSEVAVAASEGALEIYRAPDDPAPIQTLTNPRLINDDPAAPVPLTLLVTGTPASNCDWLEVLLPVRPNGTTGWVRRGDVTTSVVTYRLEVALEAYELRVYDDDALIDTIRIGVAKENTPTPGGTYYLTELLEPPDPNGTYGPYAFGLSGFSETFTTFNGGSGQLGIHGTNQPASIGTQASSGCIRVSNDDITRLAELLPLGTPVRIEA